MLIYRTEKAYKFRLLFFFKEYIFNVSRFRGNTICQYTMSNVYQFVSHINTFKNDKIELLSELLFDFAIEIVYNVEKT